MKNLSQSAFDISSRYILNNARYLEKLVFGHYFISPCPEKIVKAYQMYQNKDGGYGNGIEPDFRLPNSSPMATSVALSRLSQFKDTVGAFEQIEKAISYLENSYDDSIKGWESTPKMVNLYPHAQWWHFEKPRIGIHGNPSAELLGYLIEFEPFVKTLDLEALRKTYIDYILTIKEFEEHELYCIIKLFNRLSDIEQIVIKEKIIEGFNKVVNMDIRQWEGYVPYPLKFITLTEHDLFEIPENLLMHNINFIVNKLNEDGVFSPSWSWGSYDSEWEIAKREWSGILTLDALLVIKRYGAF